MRRHRDEDAHGRYPGKKQRRRITSDDDEDEDEDEGMDLDSDDDDASSMPLLPTCRLHTHITYTLPLWNAIVRAEA